MGQVRAQLGWFGFGSIQEGEQHQIRGSRSSNWRCVVSVFTWSRSLITRLAEPGFTRVPRTRWEAVASFLDIKEPFQSSCSIPTKQTLQLGSGGAWRCALLEAALLACVISPFTCCFEFYLNWDEKAKVFSGRLVLTRRLFFSSQRRRRRFILLYDGGPCGIWEGEKFPRGYAKTKTHQSDVAFTILIDVTLFVKGFSFKPQLFCH